MPFLALPRRRRQPSPVSLLPVAPALQDPLTGLASAVLCLDRLAYALAGRHVLSVGVLALVPVTGHPGVRGGETDVPLLHQVSDVLRVSLRAGDTAAYAGAGLFHVLLLGAASAEASMQVAERLRHNLRQPPAAVAGRFAVEATIGVAFTGHCRGEPSAERLLAEAGGAQLLAQQRGPGSIQLVEAHRHPRGQAAVLTRVS